MPKQHGLNSTYNTSWQASLFEQRTAWGVALCAILLIIVATSQPQWFAFTSSTQSPLKPHKQQLQQHPTHQTPASNTRTVSQTTQPPKASTAQTQQTKPSIKKQHKPAALSKPKHASKPQSLTANGFYVQIGAFKDSLRAKNMRHTLNKKGWNVHIIKRKSSLHAIWIGPVSSHSKAEKLLQNIQRKLKYKGFIVHKKRGE